MSINRKILIGTLSAVLALSVACSKKKTTDNYIDCFKTTKLERSTKFPSDRVLSDGIDIIFYDRKIKEKEVEDFMRKMDYKFKKVENLEPNDLIFNVYVTNHEAAEDLSFRFHRCFENAVSHTRFNDSNLNPNGEK